MKAIKIGCLAGLLALSALLGGCEKQQIGFLQAENAVYVPDQMDIRLVLDEELDAFRIYNVAPWVSPKVQGLAGTTPLNYEVVSVTSEQGDATMFQALLSIRGGGRLEFPLVSDITPGEYVVSVRVFNEGHSYIMNNAFTFIVK